MSRSIVADPIALSRAPASDRFAAWPRTRATAMLAAFSLLLGLAALGHTAPHDAQRAAPTVFSTSGERDVDRALYHAIVQRVAAGEGYYHSALTEQRARSFPVRPGPAVRLPTLAVLAAWLGIPGMAALGASIALATLVVWWRRLGVEPGGREHRAIGLLLIIIGAGIATKPHYLLLHEVWAGLLLALAFGLHRPGRWRSSLAAAAAALAFRELALPFVMLFGALAVQRRDWHEAAAWVGLAALFALAMIWHLAHVSAMVLPSDPAGPAWLVFRGLDGWVTNLVNSSILHQLPPAFAAILALLPLIGWAGWKSSAGFAGLLLHSGYGLFFMIAGRSNNFYWALMVMPTWFLGLAFAPQALASLVRRALGSRAGVFAALA